MMKMKTLLLGIMMLGMPLAAGAYDFESDGVYYGITGPSQVAVVTGDNYEGAYDGDVYIPDSVSHDGMNYTVTEIYYDAFFKCTRLGDVFLPSTITSLHWDAFLDAFVDDIVVRDLETWCNISFEEDGCFGRMDPYPDVEVGIHGLVAGGQQVTDVVIPESITRIHDFTFYKTGAIRSVEIPGHVTRVGMGAFFGCTDLKSLKIGAGVDTIGHYAFNTDYYLFDWEFNVDRNVIDEVVCQATVPPVMGGKYCFNQATYKCGTLYVPAQSLRAYCMDENWSRFENILPIPEPASRQGDVNGDGVLNVTDVTTLIDLLLNGDH